MITKPMDVLEQFPIRKSKKQKKIFRQEVKAYVTDLGYQYTEEKGSMGAKNIIIGDPKTAEYLVTAHYDTPAALPFPNFITPCNFWVFLAYQLVITAFMLLIPAIPGVLVGWLTDSFALGYDVWYLMFWVMLLLMMVGPANKSNANDNTSGVVSVLELVRTLPEDHRNKVCFILFDLEEAGLVGSASYRSKHKKETNKQTVLNLDCVGDGDEIVMFPTKKLRKDEEKMAKLDAITVSSDSKKISLHKKGFAYSPSDHANFPYGVGIMAFNRGAKIGLYCDRIHTRRDTILDETNVNIIRAALTTLITGSNDNLEE